MPLFPKQTMPLDPEAPTMRWLLQLGGDLCPQTLGLAARRPKNQVTESAHSPRPPEGAEAGWRARASRPHTDFSSALTPALDREAAAPSHAARGPCSQGAQLWTRSRPGCSWSPGAGLLLLRHQAVPTHSPDTPSLRPQLSAPKQPEPFLL